MMSERTVQELCANCKDTLEMLVVQEDEKNPDMVWVECPSCHEIKPLNLGRREEGEKGAAPEAMEPPESRGPSKRTYPGDTDYQIGDTVYHSAWDDTGEVVDKKFSSGGHPLIVVEFKIKGKKKLLVQP